MAVSSAQNTDPSTLKTQLVSKRSLPRLPMPPAPLSSRVHTRAHPMWFRMLLSALDATGSQPSLLSTCRAMMAGLPYPHWTERFAGRDQGTSESPASNTVPAGGGCPSAPHTHTEQTKERKQVSCRRRRSDGRHGAGTCTGLELWPNLQRAGAWRTQIFSQEVGHGQAVNMDAKHRAEVRGSGLEWEEQRGDWPRGQDRRARWGDSRQLMGLWGAEAVGCEGATHPADGGRGCEQPGRSLRCAVSSVYVSASPTRPGGGSQVAGRLAGPRQKLTRGSFIPMFHFNTASSLVSSLSFPKVPGKKSSPHFHIQPTSSWVIA